MLAVMVTNMCLDTLGGISALSAKIHGMGLKFGVYNDVGPGTCAGNPGLNVSIDGSSDAQLKRDVALMADKWKIDSIKVFAQLQQSPKTIEKICKRNQA